MILETKDSFVSLSDEFEWKENRQLKIIKAPDFFNERSQNPDQQIIDLMALSHPPPKLFILAVDSENTNKEKVIDQIRQLQDTFGERIIANLALTVPDIESFRELRDLQDTICISVTMATENLAAKYTECYLQRPCFKYNSNKYITDAVERRRTTLEKRR